MGLAKWGTNFDSSGPSVTYDCGHCGSRVSSELGTSLIYIAVGRTRSPSELIRVCPNCLRPSFLGPTRDIQIPAPLPGSIVDNLPDDVAALHLEIRKAIAAGVNTAAVLTARKLLMHVAVALGAKARLGFEAYVEYIISLGYVPPGAESNFAYLKVRANHENHRILLADREDALLLLRLIELVLRNIYEFPNASPQEQIADA